MTETAVAPGIDRRKLAELKEREDAAFIDSHAGSIERWNQAKTVMPNGVPMSWLRTSYDHPPLFVAEGNGRAFPRRRRPRVRRLQHRRHVHVHRLRAGTRGGGGEPAGGRRDRSSCCRPRTRSGSRASCSAATACRCGSSRWRRPAPTPRSIRIARTITGREKVLFFDGKYHGHFDEALVELEDGRLVPEEEGLPHDVTSKTTIVPFNDLEALRAALGDARGRGRDHRARRSRTTSACCCRTTDFHAELRAMTRETGTLLAYDETHTQVVGPGGLTRHVGARARLRDGRASRSPPASRWARTA